MKIVRIFVGKEGGAIKLMHHMRRSHLQDELKTGRTDEGIATGGQQNITGNREPDPGNSPWHYHSGDHKQ